MNGERRAVPIDEPVLLAALVARDEGLLATFVDLDNGKLMRLFDPAVTGRDNDAVWARIDQAPERYAEIPRYTREFRLMQDFVDLVDDDDLARLLDTALSGREAFRKFEQLLAAWPREHARWKEFRRDALLRWGVAWLRSLDCEPPWARDMPEESGLDVPEILRVALEARGGAGERTVHLESADLAIRLFVQLSRQLCELRREPLLARHVRQLQRFRRGGVEISRDDLAVTITIAPRDPAAPPSTRH